MTNVATQGGLRFYKGVNSTVNLELVLFTSSESNNIGLGDAVVTSSGNAATDGNGGPNARAVTKAATSGAILGTIEGFLPQMVNGVTNPNLSIVYRPASTTMYALMRRAVNGDRYLISDDGTAIGVAGIGKTAQTVQNACNTATGLSKITINHSTGTTATNQLRIVDVLDTPTNDSTLGNAVYVVEINNCETGQGTGALGV